MFLNLQPRCKRDLTLDVSVNLKLLSSIDQALRLLTNLHVRHLTIETLTCVSRICLGDI